DLGAAPWTLDHVVEHADLVDPEPVLWLLHTSKPLDPAPADACRIVSELLDRIADLRLVVGPQPTQVLHSLWGQEDLVGHSGQTIARIWRIAPASNSRSPIGGRGPRRRRHRGRPLRALMPPGGPRGRSGMRGDTRSRSFQVGEPVAQHALEVLARLGNRRHAAAFVHAADAGVVGGEGQLEIVPVAVEQLAQVPAAGLDVLA